MQTLYFNGNNFTKEEEIKMNKWLKTKVKEWYRKEYPEDELGEEIDNNVTFNDVFECLNNYRDVYECLSGEYTIYQGYENFSSIDSVIRERVFEKLAEIIKVDYDYIYDQWLKSSRNRR